MLPIGVLAIPTITIGSDIIANLYLTTLKEGFLLVSPEPPPVGGLSVGGTDLTGAGPEGSGPLESSG